MAKERRHVRKELKYIQIIINSEQGSRFADRFRVNIGLLDCPESA